jgi:hypothetical protein
MTNSPNRLFCAALLAALAAPAAVAGPIPDDLVKAEVIGGWPTKGGYMAALRLTLSPGWKTYWRAPGEAGIPPEFDWRASSNLGDVTYHWPAPQVFEVGGLRTLGYHDALVLPIEFSRLSADQPLQVRGQISLGVCKDICVPATVEVAATLTGAGPDAPAIKAALAQGPRDGRTAGLGPALCRTEPTRDGLRLTTDIALKGAATGDFAVIELTGQRVWVAPVEARAGAGHLVQVSDLVPTNAQPFGLDRSAVRMTVFAAGGAVYDLMGCTGQE